MTRKLTINIFNTDLIWIGSVDSVESLVHRTSWHEIPNSEMTVSKTAQGVEELQIGRILVVNNQLDRALIIEDLTASINDEYISYNLISLKGMLNYRICHPTDSGSFAAKNQSTVMSQLASNNLVTQTRDNERKFWNAAKTKNMFQVATGIIAGDVIDYTVDWETGNLGDAITDVSKMFGLNATVPMGWNVYIKDDFSAFEMLAIHGKHKHVNQSTLPPVVFSEEFGNIKNATYEYSIKDWRNVVYMIWQDTADNNKETITKNLAHGAADSFNRKEIIVSSSKKLSTQIFSEGRSEVNKRPHVENFTAEIINNIETMTTYLKDWDIGDIVTVQSAQVLPNIIISIDVQITEIEETYAAGEYSINATFGETKLSLVQLVKNAIQQKK